MSDEPFNGSAQPRDDCVVLLVAYAELTAGRSLTWGDHTASLVTFVTDPAARVPNNLSNRCADERGSIMSLARKGIGNVDRRSIEQADQLRVEPGRAVFTAPQLVVIGIGPAGGDRAVHQAHPTVDQLDASCAVGTNSSKTAFTSGTSVVTILDTVDCDVSLKSPTNSCVTFWRRYMQASSTAWYNPNDFGRPVFLFHGSVKTP